MKKIREILEFPVAVGVDWARDAVQVCVLVAGSQREWQREFACVGAGLHDLVEWLPETTGHALSEMGVVIERPEGLVVEHLLSSGLAVHHLKATSARAMRTMTDPSGAKDDERDARCLARSLWVSPEALRELEAPRRLSSSVRDLDRYLTTLGREKVRIMQRIQDQLGRIFPELLSVLGGQPVSAPWFLELVSRVPTPDRAKRVWVSTLEDLVKRNRLRRFDGEKLKAALARKPARAFEETVESASWIVRKEVRRLKALLRDEEEVKEKRDALLAELAAEADRERAEAREREEARERAEAREAEEARERAEAREAEEAREEEEAREAEPELVEVVTSMPGVGSEVLATLVAEGGEAFLGGEYRKLRQLAGTAPVTVSSGRTKWVKRRRARNMRLETAMFQAARVHAQRDAGGRAYYRRLMESGSGRGTALRKVGDRMLRILAAMVRTRTTYDGTRWAPAEAA